jgi:hypothetical protein
MVGYNHTILCGQVSNIKYWETVVVLHQPTDLRKDMVG